MKTFLLFVSFLAVVSSADGQVIKRLANRAKNKLEQKAGQKVDKTIDDAVDGKKDGDKADGSNADDSETTSTDAGSSASTTTTTHSGGEGGTPTLKTYSKYDFIPGEKMLVYEDFRQDAVGDFPGQWNTNSSGEVVNISGREGKWFKISKEGAFLPEFITNLPDNFTLEFDLGVNNDFSYYSTEFWISMVNLANRDEEYADWGRFGRWNGKHAVRMSIHAVEAGSIKRGRSKIITGITGSHLIDNDVTVSQFNHTDKNITHVSIWRQNQRMRVYVNNEKIWDLPKAFGQGATYNSLVFGTGNFHKSEDFYVINNIRLAIGAPDTRNKLITEGKFVTRGILFDVNSDQIKPESYGTLKDIAGVLSENAGVKVRIIGHTDSDGEESFNMDLSKRRAEAVKKALVAEFSIDGQRLETDGRGESEPVDKTGTPLGKAINRRVEFVKL